MKLDNGWSYRKYRERICTWCRKPIKYVVAYEVFDDRGNSKGPHHRMCAQTHCRLKGAR